MLHLKPYKLFESNENEFLSDIKDCFMHVADIGIPLKYSIDNYYMIDSNAISIDLLITLSHNISKSESGETNGVLNLKNLLMVMKLRKKLQTLFLYHEDWNIKLKELKYLG